MRIVVGSQSAIKIDAVQDAFAAIGVDAEVVGVRAHSGAPEQPLNDETIQGARNRTAHAKELDPNGDLYVAIQNGIFEEQGRFIDKAVVVCATKHVRDQVSYSDGVEFPRSAVEEARRRGFDRITVGKVMAEQGLVAKHDDPHLTLAGKPRARFLTETVSVALAGLSVRIVEQLSAKYRGSNVWLNDALSYVTDYRNYIRQGLISGDDAREVIGELDDLDGAGAAYFEDLAELIDVALPLLLARLPADLDLLIALSSQAEQKLDDIREAHEDIESLTTEMQTYAETYAVGQSQSEGSVAHQSQRPESVKEESTSPAAGESLSQQPQLESVARSALRRTVGKIPGVNKAIEAIENRRGRGVR
jgi:inosine/xanthosine triphosphatase